MHKHYCNRYWETINILTAFSISLSFKESMTFKIMTGVVKKNKIIIKKELVNKILQYRL